MVDCSKTGYIAYQTFGSPTQLDYSKCVISLDCCSTSSCYAVPRTCIFKTFCVDVVLPIDNLLCVNNIWQEMLMTSVLVVVLVRYDSKEDTTILSF